VRTDLYTLCWNEADVLGFFFRHYDPWVDRYVVFDDGSTDGSVELLRAHPRVELRRFERQAPGSFVASQLALQDEIWKESRGEADWVVVTAIDEHLWIPGRPMADALRAYAEAGVTAVPGLGYQMISDTFPSPGERLCETRTHGAPFPDMNKLSLFRPDALSETGYAVGRHEARPEGAVRYPAADELLVLHYKYLGFERLVSRHALLRSGLGEDDVRKRWGTQYGWEVGRTRQDWYRISVAAVDLAAGDHVPHRDRRDRRWWREGIDPVRFGTL
jgi:hypothetical protein